MTLALVDTPVPTRAQLLDFEAAVAAQPQIEFPIREWFTDSLYGREMFVPAGATAVGDIHLYDHLCVVLGDIEIRSEEGATRITGCETFVSKAGVKRAGYAHADSWWTTIHPNPDGCRDGAVLRSRLVVKTYAQLETARREALAA